jgi:hypothetical protein
MHYGIQAYWKNTVDRTQKKGHETGNTPHGQTPDSRDDDDNYQILMMIMTTMIMMNVLMMTWKAKDA